MSPSAENDPPYEACVIDASGNCTRWSHDHGTAENDALAGEVWQEADNVLLLCVEPGVTWQDFNGHQFHWNAPTIARPLRRLLDRAGNLAPEYGKTRPIPPGAETDHSDTE